MFSSTLITVLGKIFFYCSLRYSNPLQLLNCYLFSHDFVCKQLGQLVVKHTFPNYPHVVKVFVYWTYIVLFPYSIWKYTLVYILPEMLSRYYILDVPYCKQDYS